MPVRCLILFGLVGLVACRAPALVGVISPTPPSERNHLEAMAGFSLNLPDTWAQQEGGFVTVLHGPAGTDAFYATLTIQRRLTWEKTHLDEAVAHALAAVAHEAGFVWDNLDIRAVGQDLALGYGVRFNALEVSHRQTGLVFVHNDVLVALTLSAPSDLFESVIPVFERATESIVMLPRVVRPTR